MWCLRRSAWLMLISAMMLGCDAKKGSTTAGPEANASPSPQNVSVPMKQVEPVGQVH